VRFVTRLVLGTFTIVVFTTLLVLWGTGAGVPGVVVLALAMALALAWLAGRSIARPLVALSDAALDIAAGSTPRFPRSGIPEVDTLVQALRRMHRDQADRVAELQQEKAGGNAIVDAMVEGVIASDARGAIVIANPAARRLLGYPPGASLPNLRTLFRARNAREAVTEVLAGEDVHDREVDLDGRVLSLNARPFNGQGAVVVLHDLTQVRRLEAVRRDFVANVSHELKTPLTSIAGYADTLKDAAIDEATRQRFLETIVTNTNRMQRLVDDLLDLSRIESGRWTPKTQSLELGPLAIEAWEAFRQKADARDVQFRLSVAPDASDLNVDADALRQILSNLFDNALRYVAAGGEVVFLTERVDGGVALCVRDNGAGIAGDHVTRIFERFYRVDPARSRDEGGTGLGLAIVRHLVEAHGGWVAAESELQRGTTIRCWFPLASERETMI
jgi:signal transduction histidine kinase